MWQGSRDSSRARARFASLVDLLPSRRVEMNRMPKEAINTKQALRELPPLLKGYLRLGAHIGDGAVIDHQFGTTDVLVVVPMAQITARYRERFVGASAEQKIAA